VDLEVEEGGAEEGLSIEVIPDPRSIDFKLRLPL
jgi:hypothetical protein